MLELRQGCYTRQTRRVDRRQRYVAWDCICHQRLVLAQFDARVPQLFGRHIRVAASLTASQTVWPPQSGSSSPCASTLKPFSSRRRLYSVGLRLPW